MIQGTLEDLGTPLSDVTFVVVDLETTGGSPQECGITEFGAVKVRGGEVLGEGIRTLDPNLGKGAKPFRQAFATLLYDPPKYYKNRLFKNLELR